MTEPSCSGCRGRTNLKRCSGCQNAHYCSTECQQKDWVFHIFYCNPRREINTADILARAVYQDLFPGDPPTCREYGFFRAVTEQEQSYLLGLYIGLIKLLKVQPLTVHRWRVRGVLVDKIKETFFKLPANARGMYFPWFLENEHLIAEAGDGCPAEAIKEAWSYLGGDPNLPCPAIVDAAREKPPSERDTFLLCTAIFLGGPPSPVEFNVWTEFGFASCKALVEEGRLAARYRQLIERSTFAEFSGAHKGLCLLDLFHAKSVPVEDPRGHLRDILRSDKKKSVWYLKQTVRQDESVDWLSRMHPSTVWDYGFFISCIGDAQRLKLKLAYRAFFDRPNADPLALHEAAMKGEIYNCVSSIVAFVKNDEDYKELMKNPYSLDEGEESRPRLRPGESFESSFYDEKTETYVTTFGGML